MGDIRKIIAGSRAPVALHSKNDWVIAVFFRRIGELRIDHDLTQKEIADYLNMHLTVYRRYEKGEREIPVWALIKLAKYYHTTADYILELSEKQ